MREIFLSKKEGGVMEQTLDMNNHFIANVKTPKANDHATNKNYVDNGLNTKLNKRSGFLLGNLNANNKKINRCRPTRK